MRHPIRHFAALAFAAFCLPVSAQSLKPGVWEVTSKVGGNPQVDQAMAQMQKELANMPPEQRKQMEAMMAQRGMQMPSAGKGMSMKICMTKAMAEKNDMPMQQGCAITRNERSGNVTNIAFTCTNPPSSGEGQFTSSGPEAYASRMTVRTMHQGKPETVTMEGSGKWLSADCGALAPPATPAAPAKK